MGSGGRRLGFGNRTVVLALIAAVAVVGVLFAVAWPVLDDHDEGTGAQGTSTPTSGAAVASPAPTLTNTSSSPQPGRASAHAGAKGVSVGVWAGNRLVLTVTESGANAEFECASGVLDGPLLLDARGHFDVSGWYRRQSGGPAPSGQQPPALRARFRGSTQGTDMDLTVVMVDTSATHGPFQLKLGAPVRIERCL